MSAFGDFGPLSERRKAEKSQKRRRHIMMAAGAISVFIIIAAVSAAAVILVNKKGDDSGNHSRGSPMTTTAVSTSKVVETVCSNTDHKQSCASRLHKATNSTSTPKDVVKASVSVIYAAVDQAFGQSRTHNSDSPLVQSAVAVCDQMLEDSKFDLLDTMDQIEVQKLENLPKIGPMLNIWLSAVRTYQETCVDAFPEGPDRDKMKAAMKDVNEWTSDALAIMTKLGKFVSTINSMGSNRRLLLVEDDDLSRVDGAGIPSWVGEKDRRVLAENAEVKLVPDVTVAQDGSGNFKTITEALKAIPEGRRSDERYVIYVKAGVYDEQANVTKTMKNVTMYGDGYGKTIVTGSKSFGKDKIETMYTASFGKPIAHAY